MRPSKFFSETPDLAEFITVKEAAHELGFSVRGVQNLVRKSKLKALLVGKMYLVSRDSVKQYLDQTKGMSKNNPMRGKQPKAQ